MRTLRRLGPDLWLLAASVTAAAAVARLFQGDLAGRATGALLVSAAVGSAVPALLARKGVPLPIRAVAGTLAVILTSLWAAIGAATAFGLPTARTWHVVKADLRAARPLLGHFAVPLRPAPGLVFLAAMTCGVVAMLASVLLYASDTRDRAYPGLALLCPFGLLAFVCSQSTPGSMAVPVILFVAAGALTLTTARADSVRQPVRSPRRSRITATVVTACTMAGVLLVAVLANSGAEGAGTSGPGVAPAVPLSAESLTSNLLSVEVHDANDSLFQAHSEFRTYWQVAVLNVLRNGVWVPDPDTENAAHSSTAGAPATRSEAGSASLGGGSRDFKATIRIDDLSSRILPVPPGTVALAGTSATLTGVGAVSPMPTTSGQQYTTFATPPVTEPETLGGNAPVATYPSALVQADTALPSLPPNIEALARSLTTGAQGPLAEAELLVNWFRSGLFHYTLDPPAPSLGTDPLVSFLTQTRSGSCEQFAGAFVVLARSLGLPSRVVVGFTAGRYSGPGEVTVRGADAHAWPQVYLGPRAGWVSFEPTPQQPRGELAPEGVVGPSGVSTTTPTTPVGSPTTAPSPTAPFPVPTTVPIPHGSNNRSPTTTPTPGSGLGPVWWTLIGAAALLAVLLLALLIRRGRRWSPAGRTPDQLALLSQAEVDRALRRAGVERPPWQPMELFFEEFGQPGADPGDARPTARSPAGVGAASLVADGVRVARSADAALFDPLAASDQRTKEAYQAALRVRKGLPRLVTGSDDGEPGGEPRTPEPG
jgi:transglutaminase-like putative cysteine protease